MAGDDQDDDLEDDDRVRLHAALDRSQQDFQSGRGIPDYEVLAELRAKAGRGQE